MCVCVIHNMHTHIHTHTHTHKLKSKTKTKEAKTYPTVLSSTHLLKDALWNQQLGTTAFFTEDPYSPPPTPLPSPLPPNCVQQILYRDDNVHPRTHSRQYSDVCVCLLTVDGRNSTSNVDETLNIFMSSKGLT